MSHYTVLVKVIKDRLDRNGGNVQKAVAEMLAPYNEQDEKYMEFIDKTDEIQEVCKEFIESDSWMGEKHPEWVGKTIEEAYGGFNQVAEEYFQYNKEDGVYGYRSNPNSKWDWYQIGGRWSGLLPAKKGSLGERSWTNYDEDFVPQMVDFCQKGDLDLEKMNEDVQKKMESFWEEYEEWKVVRHLKGYKMHYSLMEMGLGTCVKEREEVTMPDGTTQDIAPVFEYKELTKEKFFEEYRWYFEFSTFAVLDDNGWKEQGEMGWFGCSSDTTEDRQLWGKSYYQNFIANEDPETTFVIVDCHI